MIWDKILEIGRLDMQKKNCDLILALDLPDKESALEMLGTLKGSLRWVKIGLQMYVRYGADFVREVSDMDFKIFLDLKLHDIPNTVASAIKSLRSLPVDMLTIHTSGGREMMISVMAASAARYAPLYAREYTTALGKFSGA